MQLKTLSFALSCLCAGVILGAGNLSPSIEMIASPSSVYWTTLVTDAPCFVCTWPKDATAAQLSVTGSSFAHSQNFTRQGTEEFLKIQSQDLDVPIPTGDDRLYTLVLTFDTGISHTGRVACVRGAFNLGTRVLATGDLSARAWQKVSRRALIPIPERGVEVVALNGVNVPAGVNGECGWFEWEGIPIGANTFTMGGQTATFLRAQDGSCFLVR